jgi:hypothetical protein
MLDDKLAATDWEATQDELIQQITRESYIQWLHDTKQQNTDNKTVFQWSILMLYYYFIFLDTIFKSIGSNLGY